MTSIWNKVFGFGLAVGMVLVAGSAAADNDYICKRKADRAWQNAYNNCMDGFNPSRCYRDSDCDWNEKCIAGRCKYVDRNECYSDRDCGRNEHCIAGRCKDRQPNDRHYSCGSCYREYGQYYQYDVYSGSSLVETVRSAGASRDICENWYRTKDYRCR